MLDRMLLNETLWAVFGGRVLVMTSCMAVFGQRFCMAVLGERFYTAVFGEEFLYGGFWWRFWMGDLV